MYAILLFFSLLGNVFGMIAAMEETESYPFHRIVENITDGRYGEEVAKKRIIQLLEQDKNPNEKKGGRTALQVSAEHYVQFAVCAKDQFSIFFTLFDLSKEKNEVRTETLDYLGVQKEQVMSILQRFNQMPFRATLVKGGGFFIDDDNEEERRYKDKEDRIKKLIEELEKRIEQE